jgi:hypothetical protein
VVVHLAKYVAPAGAQIVNSTFTPRLTPWATDMPPLTGLSAQ